MLKGAREIIARFKPAPYVEDHREEKSAALSEYIQFILLFEQI